jgi:hypothetical protein
MRLSCHHSLSRKPFVSRCKTDADGLSRQFLPHGAWAQWRVLRTLRSQLPRAGRSCKAFTAAVINELLQAKKLELSLQVFPWLGLDRAALAGPSIRASRPSPFSN